MPILDTAKRLFSQWRENRREYAIQRALAKAGGVEAPHKQNMAAGMRGQEGLTHRSDIVDKRDT